MRGAPPDHASDQPDQDRDDIGDVLRLHAPARQTRPLVVASPHSGTRYPPSFLELSKLSPRALRASEDTHVDTIFAAAPTMGAPLLCALIPRVFLDLNREPLELDPAMFGDALPPHANTDSARVRAGLGTVPRVAGEGQPIYRRKLSFAEAERRIQAVYHPYHTTLTRLITETRTRFGFCILLDCHSMPRSAVEGLRHAPMPDIVLGDRHGTACAPGIVDAAERCLRDQGFRVRRNDPYAGGFTTSRHGRPGEDVHALQIEINRGLYMNEATRAPTAGLADLRRAVPALLEAVSGPCGTVARAAE